MRNDLMLSLVLLTLAFAPGQAATIYNSFGPGDTYSANHSDFGSGWTEAAVFTVPYDSKLTRIEIALGLVGGPGVLELAVVEGFFQSDPVLESFGPFQPWLSPPPIGGSIVSIDSVTQPLLRAGHSYWLWAMTEVPWRPELQPTLTWYWSSSPYTGTPGAKRAFVFVSDTPDHEPPLPCSEWLAGRYCDASYRDDLRLAFRISGDPVPEPGSIVLAGLGSASLMVGARWRRRTRRGRSRVAAAEASRTLSPTSG